MLKVNATALPGLLIVETKASFDKRGAFYRCFCDQELVNVFGDRAIRQVNHSRTEQVGAVRGLHYQIPPHSEMKFVRCIRGRVWDVALDIRRDSPTFLQWNAVELSPDNRLMLIIPEGFAHGFQVLEGGSEMLYLHTHPYVKTAEGGVRFDDPRIGINWPLTPSDISERDQNMPWLSDQFTGI